VVMNSTLAGKKVGVVLFVAANILSWSISGEAVQIDAVLACYFGVWTKDEVQQKDYI